MGAGGLAGAGELVKSGAAPLPACGKRFAGVEWETMKRLLPLLLLACCLASCVHTAAAPMSTPSGEPAAMRVRGVAKGRQAMPSQLLAIDEQLLAGVTAETLVWRYFPDLEGKVSAEATLMGIVGDLETTSGKQFHGYVPIVVLRANAPAARVEEAAARMAVDLYARAKKISEVYPLSQLADPERARGGPLDEARDRLR